MADELSGAEVFKHAEAAYEALSSYSGASAVIVVSEQGSSVEVNTSSAQIQFMRDQGLRIEGRSANEGKPFTLVSDMERMWLLYEKLNEGAWQESPGLNLGAVTGIAAGAASTVPAALLGMGWANPFVAPEMAQLQGREPIASVDCFKVVRETMISRDTLWIDSATFLLRQMRQEQNTSHMDALLSSSREHRPEDEARLDRLASIRSIMSLHVFAISSINELLDPSLFHKPEPN